MFYAILGHLHAALWRLNVAVTRRAKAIQALAGERGQGTVEYVGLILLVAGILTAVVIAGAPKGADIGKAVVDKLSDAIDGVGDKK